MSNTESTAVAPHPGVAEMPAWDVAELPEAPVFH